MRCDKGNSKTNKQEKRKESQNRAVTAALVLTRKYNKRSFGMDRDECNIKFERHIRVHTLNNVKLQQRERDNITLKCDSESIYVF